MDTKNDRPYASLSLDADNLWSYLKIRGDKQWRSYPSYFEYFIPLALKILNNLNLKITFFIVGADAAQGKNHKLIKMICNEGHEVGNHSFSHESWLQQYSKQELAEEVLKADTAIRDAAGQRPMGFRGPGFSWSADLMEVLATNHYMYDASILPTFIGPIARAYYFKKSNLSETEKGRRKELFSKFNHGFLPVKPFYWRLQSRLKLLEIPVTTIPVAKTPFHFSYLLYLSHISKILMLAYLQLAIIMCKADRTAPSFLLHPLDILGGDDVPELSFFPGMDLNREKKLKLVYLIMGKLKQQFDFLPMLKYVDYIKSDEKLTVKKISKIYR